MRPALDNIFFDDETFEIEVKTLNRGVVQRSAAGLDGQLTIDMGLRERKLAQTGQLRAKNEAELQRQIDAINELIDGQLHILRSSDGRVFDNLLVETFETESVIKSGAYMSCSYHITYIKQA
ncbi:MAG: hypothetical protein LLF92_05325 [Planctomycetaceae bacterium]|nr:hypothetical protein [Planctomycetaceae bacterium]